MRIKEVKEANAAQIYEQEFQLLEKIKKIQTGNAISYEELLKEYIALGEEYGKLLKQAIKITRVGDSNQKKLFLANEKIEKQKEELSKAYKKLDMLARIDPLTGLSNRRDFIEKFQAEKIRFERKGNPFSLVLCDIDDFKFFNDRYGHDCGDFLLENIARLIRSMVRKQDVVGRWGGEEFILLLPETPLQGGKKISEEIRKKVAKKSFSFNNHQLSITMTFGVSEFSGTTDIIPCIKEADEALYYGKRKGKNCVVLSNQKQRQEK